MATESKQNDKTIAEDMDSRTIFSNVEDAVQFMSALSSRYTDVADYPYAMAGVKDGEFDPEVYNDSMDVAVAVLRKDRKVKAVVVYPSPKLDALMADDAAKAWVESIIRKELNHVAVRKLREAEDVATVVSEMPTTISGYIESGRGDGGIVESFNELYKKVLAFFNAKVPAFAKARLKKAEFKKALENRAFALDEHAALEDRAPESLFVTALKLFVVTAKRDGIDPTIFERWMATRDAQTWTPGTSVDDDDLDLGDIDSLADAMLAEAASANVPVQQDSTDTKTA